MTSSRDTATDVELYVRSLASPGSCDVLDSVLDRLERLEETGHITAYTVEIWGKELTVSTANRTEAGRQVLGRLSSFVEWADRTEHSLECFDRRRVHSEMIEESYQSIRLPTMVLAEYEGEQLRHVAPCRDGETVVTISDRLDALESKTPQREPVITGSGGQGGYDSDG